MRFPKFIKKGDAIGFVAPSFGCEEQSRIRLHLAERRRTSGIWVLVYRSGQIVIPVRA